MYRDSQDLQKTLAKIAQDIDSILRRQPKMRSPQATGFKAQVAGLLALLSEPANTVNGNEAYSLMDAIEKWGEKGAVQFGPSVQQVAPRLNTIRETLQAAGIHALPIYGLPDDAVGVLAEDIARLGLQGDLSSAITAGGGPAFSYRGITADALPQDQHGKPLPEAKRLWLFLDRSQQEQGNARSMKAALLQDFDRFVRMPPLPTARSQAEGYQAFKQTFGGRGERSWEASTTQGKGLLALLGVEQAAAEKLLETHLDIAARSGQAAQIMPALANGDNDFQVALERALRGTSERILEGLAVGRASGGRRGLDVPQAVQAQTQLSQPLTALSDVARNKADVIEEEEDARGEQTYRIRTRKGPGVLHLLIRPQRFSGAGPARLDFRLIEFEKKVLGNAVMLSLELSGKGAAYALSFSADRINWGVHGGLPTDPLIPDHLFYDGMPSSFQAPAGALARETMKRLFANYIESRFLPEVIGDL